MMRVLAAALGLACSAAVWADTDMELFRKLTASVLKVEAQNDDGSVSLGTGVVVASGIVVTNCHVTRGAHAIELVRGAARHEVESQQSDVEHDLCLLYSSQVQDEPVVAIPMDRPRVGQPVYAVGFVLGIAPRLNAGEISALYDYDDGKVIETDAAFSSGASGGGLFDPDGHLVGIVTFRSRGADAHHFCLPGRWVTEALNRPSDSRPVAPITGTPFWQRPREVQPYFLRAATLDAERNWSELAAVARQWSFAESGNASSWFVLGKAYARMNERPQAIEAYKTAVAVDADFAEAWYGLGLAYADSGEPAELERVRNVLDRLDPRLARQLTHHHSGACREPSTFPC